MSFQDLMLTYGYPALFIGVLLESEAFLLVGVYLAHRGYFSLPAVIALAAFSSFSITQFCFYLGQRYGRAFLDKRPRWQPRFIRVEKLLERYGNGLVLGFRAFYGLRGMIPAAVGVAGYPALRFMLVNIGGAVAWALVVGLAGNQLAQVSERIVACLVQYERPLLVGIASIGGLWSLYQLIRQAIVRKPVTPDTIIN